MRYIKLFENFHEAIYTPVKTDSNDKVMKDYIKDMFEKNIKDPKSIANSFNLDYDTKIFSQVFKDLIDEMLENGELKK